MDSDKPCDYSQSRAVLIGTSEYQDERFPALPSADNSLEGMHQILTDPELCGWPPGRVKQLANVSDSRQVIIKLREWAQKTTGVFLLYYVGHGTPGERGPCLTLADTQEQHPDATGLEYRHVRNAAFRPGPPIPRFPREPEPSVPWWRQRWGALAAAALLVAVGATTYGTVRWLDGSGPQCGTTAGASAQPGGAVVIESDLDADPEDLLIAYIYLDALQGNGVRVDTNVTPSLRVAYYDQVCAGTVTIVPEYNGALLTTSVDQSSSAVSTGAVDDALDRDLPSSLEILAPAAAQWTQANVGTS
ncbi:MAG TPA: hypothetical protein VGM10_28150 [Actinocrinis sp.]|jgi:hypothetical protein